jgi:hypothetical protein
VDPAQEDVAGGLRQPLAFDHSPAVLRGPTAAQNGLQHRRLCLLDLQEQRVVRVAAQQQHHPAAGSDAADPHHLSREVNGPEAVRMPQPRQPVLRPGLVY